MTRYSIHEMFTLFAAGLCAGAGIVFAATGSPGSAAFCFVLCAINVGTILLRRSAA